MEITDSEVVRIREDKDQLNRFIEQHKSFVIHSANKTLNRFITESDDEFSIALIAFSEAVDTYDEEKGHFHPFASMLIRRRLIDYIRKETGRSSEISVEPSAMDADIADEAEATPIQLEVRRRTAELSENSSAGDRPVKDEIEALSQILSGYGFSFFDLTECSPRSEKTKAGCAAVVQTLLTDNEMLRRMQEKKALPIKELASLSGVKTKLLERHRKYIIAAAEILNGDYPLLAEYMSFIRKSFN
jgi:RNA polymerase sigma factor